MVALGDTMVRLTNDVELLFGPACPDGMKSDKRAIFASAARASEAVAYLKRSAASPAALGLASPSDKRR